MQPLFLCLQRGERLVEFLLPAGKVHVGDVERLQLVMQLLGLLERSDSAVQMKPDASAALLKQANDEVIRKMREEQMPALARKRFRRISASGSTFTSA